MKTLRMMLATLVMAGLATAWASHEYCWIGHNDNTGEDYNQLWTVSSDYATYSSLYGPGYISESQAQAFMANPGSGWWGSYAH